MEKKKKKGNTVDRQGLTDMVAFEWRPRRGEGAVQAGPGLQAEGTENATVLKQE